MIPVLFVAFLLVLSVVPAQAYVDPGSGSMLVQLLLGAAMAGLVMFRSVVRRIREMFRLSGSGERRSE